MSASRERKQRQELSGMGLSEKEKKALIEAKQRKRKTVAYTVLGIVAAVAVAALLIWDNGIIQKHMIAYKVGDHSYTIADVDYYIYSEYNSYYNTYGSYLFDSDTSMKEQDAYTDDDGNMMSWYQVFLEDAKTSLEQVSILCDEAEAAGYTLSEDSQSELDSLESTIKSTCESYSITESYYLQQMYGPYMTMNRLKKVTEEYLLAYEFASYKQEEFYDSHTTEDIDSYYEENSDDLDTYVYQVYYADGSVETETDEDGNTIEATDEETEAAMEAAKAVADEVLAAVEDGDTDAITTLLDDSEAGLTDNGTTMLVGSSISTTYSDFLTSAEDGEVSIIEGETGYHIVQLISREKDEYKPASYRELDVTAETDEDADEPTDEQLEAAETSANDLMGTITTEDQFIEQVSLYSTNSSADSEGLMSSVSKNSLYSSDTELYTWLYEEDREAGDMIVLPTTDGTGYRLLYFVSYDETSYMEQSIRSSLSSEDYSDWYDEVSADYTGTTAIGIGLAGKDL